MEQSKGNGLNAEAVPGLLLRGSRGMRHVHPEELRCPKRIGHRSCLEIKRKKQEIKSPSMKDLYYTIIIMPEE